MSRFVRAVTLFVPLAAFGAGCGREFFPDALPLTADEVDAIVSSSVLEPQEKRNQLSASGLDEVTINTLLRNERLANQFGGDLSVALEKVENDSFSTLTPDEIQYFGDATTVAVYTDEEALAIAELFDDYQIDSATDLTDFLDDPATELPSAIDETNLRGVFIDASLDAVRDTLS